MEGAPGSRKRMEGVSRGPPPLDSQDGPYTGQPSQVRPQRSNQCSMRSTIETRGSTHLSPPRSSSLSRLSDNYPKAIESPGKGRGEMLAGDDLPAARSVHYRTKNPINPPVSVITLRTTRILNSGFRDTTLLCRANYFSPLRIAGHTKGFGKGSCSSTTCQSREGKRINKSNKDAAYWSYMKLTNNRSYIIPLLTPISYYSAQFRGKQTLGAVLHYFAFKPNFHTHFTPVHP